MDYYGLDELISTPYVEYLERHIQYVQEAGKQIGVNPIQLKKHDLSKWSEEEFVAYAINFYGSEEQKEANKINFKYAWLHHLRHNKHHWNHWLLQNDEDGLEPLEMPQNYALEMVADWMGAGRAITGSTDMSNWLRSNYQRIILHPNTRRYVSEVLVSLGYTYGLLNGHTAVGEL